MVTPDSVAMIWLTRRWWRPPSNSVSSHIWAIIFARSTPTTRAPKASMLALLCLRDITAE